MLLLADLLQHRWIWRGWERRADQAAKAVQQREQLIAANARRATGNVKGATLLVERRGAAPR
jgi:hypothetical protein